ncbi:glutamine amidotransferase [Limnochorda pilosa]|uniref:Pyridoxal 5'-phosphate synthase subunit PdxT n=1 Tax=Limnochorda pilosa TaxID=1555112 RepID=A0A0K2SIN2_LIMPI|nr:glutamine amidotransferase [Limnochorda pilosa]
MGVLALQGSVGEHLAHLRAAGAEAVPVRSPSVLEGLAGLILPGGESTAHERLGRRDGWPEALRAFAAEGGALYGTCAGMILLSDGIEPPDPRDPRALGLLPLRVSRNAYGRQVASFEAPLEIPVLGPEPFPGVFIRAPRVAWVGDGVEVLARHAEEPVLVRRGRLLAGSFHPELTPDLRLHRLFVEMAMGREGRTPVARAG